MSEIYKIVVVVIIIIIIISSSSSRISIIISITIIINIKIYFPILASTLASISVIHKEVIILVFNL